jgi:hypothetical protein
MLVVMFVLLMATATALYAVHSTTSEVRAAGYHRMASQTQQLGESGLTAALTWVDTTGPAVMMSSMEQSAANRLDLRPFEPIGLAPNKNALRLYGTTVASDGTIQGGELNAGAPSALNFVDDKDAVVGTRQPYDTWLAVDIYDTYQYVGVIAGFPAAAQGNLKFLAATYTARGRTRLPGEVRDPLDFRTAHETASDARAHGVSGPY